MTTTTTDRIEKRIELRATPERVWRALANAREFSTWFGVELRGELVPGATVSGPITYPGYEHLTLEMTIERMEKERLLAFRWHPHAVDPDVDYSKEPTTLVEFRLEPAGSGTLLVVTESGFDKLPAGRRPRAFEMNSGGWAEQLKNIERHVAVERVEVSFDDRIDRPPAEVFQAIVDPAKMTRYFASHSSGPIVAGARLEWTFADVGAKGTVDVHAVEPDRRIVLAWTATGVPTTAAITLAPDGDGTRIAFHEGSWPMDPDGVRKALGQTRGWTDFLCCLKAFLHHGINLRLGRAPTHVA